MSTTTRLYRISSTISGQDLGTYEATSPEDALDVMARAAGYADATEAGEVTGDDGDDLLVEAIEPAPQATARDLVLCESPDGWSLHAPGSADEAIATGDAPYLVSGEGSPTNADYALALAVLAGRTDAGVR